jgi:protein-S-isoprenylcysteine O-methyltransferase Ste14
MLLIMITPVLARDNPDLLDGRIKPLIQMGQSLWGKIIKASFDALFFPWLMLMGFDAGRFHWSAMPAGLQWLGAAGILISMWIRYRTVQANPRLASVVKIRTERGHAVVTMGPYGYVRNPLYAATLLLLPSAALMLGSWFGLAATILLAGGLILRTALEDREFHRRLGGYADYAQRVRYRLVPWVW